MILKKTSRGKVPKEWEGQWILFQITKVRVVESQYGAALEITFATPYGEGEATFSRRVSATYSERSKLGKIIKAAENLTELPEMYNTNSLIGKYLMIKLKFNERGYPDIEALRHIPTPSQPHPQQPTQPQSQQLPLSHSPEEDKPF